MTSLKTLISPRLIQVAYITTVPVVGGAELNLLRVLPYLARNEVNIAAVHMPPGGGLTELFESAGYLVRNFNLYTRHGRSFWRYYHSLLKMVRQISLIGADLIHINHHYGLEFTVPAAKLTRRPFIIQVRSIESLSWISAHRSLLVQAYIIVTDSNAVKLRLVEGGIPAQRVLPVHNGIDPSVYMKSVEGSQVRNELGMPDNAVVIGIVGRIEPLKGVSDFLQAARLLWQRDNSRRFLVVGDGLAEYVAELKALVHQNGLSDFVNFTGFRNDVDRILGTLDVLVMATYDPLTGQGEACPSVVLEAMSARVPVVARRAGGVIELLQTESGVLVDPDGIEPLVDGIMTVLQMSPSERSAITDKAYKVVTTRFTLANQAHKLRQLYDLVLSGQQDDLGGN